MQPGFDKHTYRVLIALTLITLTTGTVVYHFTEHFKWVDSYYFSVITLATVGYGDFVPHTTFGKIFTTFYIFIGVGIITTFISYTVRRRGSKMKK
jgi:voltage-gated potassium channel